MPVTDNEEHGVKCELQSHDLFCMPPKKRHLHRFQSMTHPLDFSQSEAWPQHVLSGREVDYVESLQAGCSEEFLEKKPSAGLKEGSIGSLNPITDGLHELHQGLQSVTDESAITFAVDNGKPENNDKSYDDAHFQQATEETQPQPVNPQSNEQCMAGCITESIQDDKCIFHQVEDKASHDRRLVSSMQGEDNKGTVVKIEKIDTSSTDVELPKGPMSLHCKNEFDCAQRQSNRSNWDLNTMMDAWEGTPNMTPEGFGERSYADAIRNFHETKIKIHDVISSSGHLHLNSQLTFNHSSPSMNKLHSKDGISLLLTNPNASDLNLSIKPSTVKGAQSVFLNMPIKPEPYISLAGEPKMGVTQSLVERAVKPEPFVEVAEESCSFPLTKSPDIVSDMTCILPANSETKEPVSLGEITMENEAFPVPSYGSELLSSVGNASFVSDLLSAEQTADGNGKIVAELPPDNNGNDNVVYQTQASSRPCASQVSTISTEIDSGPASVLGSFDNCSLIGNSDICHLVGSLHTDNNNNTLGSVPETDIQKDSQFLGSTSPSGINSHVKSVVSSMPVNSSSGERFDMFFEASTALSGSKSSDQGVSESTACVPNTSELTLECRPIALNDPENSARKSINDESTSPLSGLGSLENSAADISGNKSVDNQLKRKFHANEDDDIEDGEVRDLHLQRTASRSLCEVKNVKQACDGELGSSVDSVVLPLALLLPKSEIDFQIQCQEENSQHLSEFAGSKCGKNVDVVEGSLAVQNSTLDRGQEIKKSKSKPVKAHTKTSRDDFRKEKHNVTKQHKKSVSGVHSAGEIGSYVEEPQDAKMPSANHSGSSKQGTKENINDSNGQRSETHNHILQLVPESKESTETVKTERKHISSRIERSSDRSLRGDLSYRRGTRRDDSGSTDSRKFDRESRKEGASNSKVENDLVRSRGRIDKQLETFRGDRKADVDYPAERFGRLGNYRFPKSRNTSEVTLSGADGSLAHSGRGMRDPSLTEGLPHRRRSPGSRERPINASMQIIHRSLRDASPGRRSDGPSDLLLLGREERFMQRMTGDVVDPSEAVDGHMGFSREDTFLQRGRSISPPILRRVPTRLTRLNSPSAARRARSPRPWSPQRPHDGFNVRREFIRGRSPSDIQVVRVRSPPHGPHARDCYMEGLSSRRCPSPPCIPRLRGEDMREVGPPREFEYIRGGVPVQRHIRRLRLINAPIDGDEEYFGLVHPRPRIQDMLEDEGPGDRRVAGERHGIIRPIRHRFGDTGEEDPDFQTEHDGSRPLRFRVGEEEEFQERGHVRAGSIRSRLGELPRRMRSVEERDDGRPWHDADFDDARMKRRRF